MSGFFEKAMESLNSSEADFTADETKPLNQLVYGFVGLGLMGGSLAKAVRKYIFGGAVPAAGSAAFGGISTYALNNAFASGAKKAKAETGKILACDINMESLEDAVIEGTIDEGFLPEDTDRMLSFCDVVYVCLYPGATLQFLEEHQAAFKSGAVVSDISGVKSSLLNNLSWTREDVFFVPGHPMAGNEREGFSHAGADIFNGRNYIFMPPLCGYSADFDASAQKKQCDKALLLIKSIATAIGFTRLIDTTPENHDHKIAFTSQLCHVIASALVDSAEDTSVTAFGGGSYEDLTRIAMINAPLWTELFIADKKELLGHINSFEKSLSVLKQAIETEDEQKLQDYLSKVRQRRISMTHPK